MAGGCPASLRPGRWLDLYSGTGSVGIEAISRGCSEVPLQASKTIPLSFSTCYMYSCLCVRLHFKLPKQFPLPFLLVSCTHVLCGIFKKEKVN